MEKIIEIELPGSKSLSNRALILSALSQGEGILKNVLESVDTVMMVESLKKLGAVIKWDRKSAIVRYGDKLIPSGERNLYVENAGTAMRFLISYLSTGSGLFRIDGNERMRQRPVKDLVDALKLMGAGIEYQKNEGYPPLLIKGKKDLKCKTEIRGNVSSQYISSLLMIVPELKRGLTLKLISPVVSMPYIQMTLQMMQKFSPDLKVKWDENQISINSEKYIQPEEYMIEPDASNASYFYAAAMLTENKVKVRGLNFSSIQGDMKFLDILRKMGGLIEEDGSDITVKGNGKILGGAFDLNDIPDTVPTLAVLAVFAEEPVLIRNIANLRVKECDRIHALKTEIEKTGAETVEDEDSLTVIPLKDKNKYQGAEIDTYDDHRMAMSFALAKLKIEGIRIRNPECVSKSFPDFFSVFERCFSFKS